LRKVVGQGEEAAEEEEEEEEEEEPKLPSADDTDVWRGLAQSKEESVFEDSNGPNSNPNSHNPAS